MTVNPFGVRAARVSDLDRLAPLVIDNYREEKPLLISEAKVANLVLRCVEQNGAIAGLIEGPSGIESSVGASIETEDYSDQLFVKVHWMFVIPMLRKRSDHNSRMLGYLKWFNEIISAKAGSPVPVIIPTFLNDNTRGKVALSLDKRAPVVGAVHGYGVFETASLQRPVGGNKVAAVSQGTPNVAVREPA